MGYYSVVSGEINYSPQLSAESQDNAIIQKYIDSDYDINIDIGWSMIHCPCEDEFKAYSLKSNLEELVAEMLKLNPDTKFTGYLEIHGEARGADGMDLWRLQVKDGKVVELQPKLVWPDA